MNVEGMGKLELYSKDKEGRFHKIHDATNEINEWFSNQKVIDKSQVDIFNFKDMTFTAYFETDEDRLRMANAKDVTPKGEE
jgi:hypothetical protein